VKREGRAAASPASPAPSRAPKVPTTTSLARKPKKRATVACQKPNPAGPNSGASIFPMLPTRLSSEPYSTPQGRLARAHTATTERRMKVPAFCRKRNPRSQACRNTIPAEGIW